MAASAEKGSDLARLREVARDLVRRMEEEKERDARRTPIDVNSPMRAASPQNRTGNPADTPRCGAHSRTTGKPCKSRVVTGRNRCRMHGGAKGSGGQRGNQNAVTSGKYTAKVKAMNFFKSCVTAFIHGDGRRMQAKLRREIEIREYLNILWIWAPNNPPDGELSPSQKTALYIADDVDIDWTPPEPEEKS